MVGSSTAYPTLAPNSTAYTNPDQLLAYGNTVVGDAFGFAILLLFIGVVFLSTGTSPFPQRALSASFVGLVISTILAGIGILNVYVPPAFLFFTVIIWFSIKDN